MWTQNQLWRVLPGSLFCECPKPNVALTMLFVISQIDEVDAERDIHSSLL
jgi:hypothetical protein